MPLPPLLLLAVTTGLSMALAARTELRTSPRPVMMTRSFAATMVFASLVVVPATVYFYVFHGDWFLLYWIEARRIPSAIALVAFVGEAILVGLSFIIGAALVRAQRDVVVGALIGLLVAGATFLLYFFRARLVLVGTTAQYRGQFGLEPIQDGPLLSGVLLMGLIAAGGWAFMLLRMWYGGRR
ncbi:MAG: hypothetical protein ACFCGT_10205 [Sandaracinaceae bacterium]